MCLHCGSFGVKSCFLRLCGVDHWRGPARGMARVRAVLHRVRGVYVCGMLFGVWSEGDEDMMRGGASARDWAHEGGRSGPEDGGRRSISRGGRSWVCDCVRSVRPIRPTDPHRDAERAGAGWRVGAGEGTSCRCSPYPLVPAVPPAGSWRCSHRLVSERSTPWAPPA